MNSVPEPASSGAERAAETGARRTPLDRNLGWIILATLVAGCLLVVQPFVSALLWAIVLCCSSWPVYERLLRRVGQRRTLAAMILTFAMLLVVVMPFVIVGSTLAGNVQQFTDAAQRWMDKGPPAPPAWLAKVPVAGPKITARWRSLEADSAKLWKEAERFIEPVSAWALRAALGLGKGLAHLALSILIALFLFRDGAAAAGRLNSMMERIAGENGKHLLRVAASTVRGVVYGILGTSLIQAILAGIGFLIAGIPGVGLLALLTFFASVIPIVGTALVWLPATIWLFQQGATGWGVFMLIWGLIVGNIDNVIKPLLISQGSKMPFILILFGVLGGALTFGFIGVFLGPTLLAVGFRVVDEWSSPTSLTLHPT